eukprot:TRINITY_DN1612_c0_g2_i1.p1 TRINITY_DN1612_c0_g2~~TRINITY_DN1612_c0_g2_i1.p1  ORF type:complete len:604 (+),score=209.33 TRINITY_DN1612_c0_g2_i1:490-2301(+)
MAVADVMLSSDGTPNGQVSLPNGPVAANGKNSEAPSAGQEKSRKEAERRRRRRKQKKKPKSKAMDQDGEGGVDEETEGEKEDEKPLEDVKIEYIREPLPISDVVGEGFEDLMKVFERFNTQEEEPVEENADAAADEDGKKKERTSDDEDDEEDEETKEDGALSNKKKKQNRRMKIAELKQICARPDVVEIWDATAHDPKLLVFLKSYRNSVPVPRHWSQKRKFLQGKRGIEKQPFQLPDFIAATGIEKIRQAYVEKEDSKKLKQKQREKMQPKMGKMDIDYQVLHDAFFKYQTKPKLTLHGDIYHEGKEFETKIRDFKPGHLSDDLKAALGMGETSPPPWLINMQRYGPPPSYPHLKIPGLNAPIPEGAAFGYQTGGWGKPPVDERGRPVYGDVFGTLADEANPFEEEPVDKSARWGDLEEDEDEEEEEEEEEDEAMGEEELEAGITSVDSLSTTPAGVETPDVINLRKSTLRKEPEKSLYTVLGEKEERMTAGTLMGSEKTYVLPGSAADKGIARIALPGKKGVLDLMKSQKSDKVDITLRPEELEGLDDSQLAAKFEQARQAEAAPVKEDFSDMVAKKENDRKRRAKEKEGKAKKQKDFKF